MSLIRLQEIPYYPETLSSSQPTYSAKEPSKVRMNECLRVPSCAILVTEHWASPRRAVIDEFTVRREGPSRPESSLACVEILGQSVLDRTIARLLQEGVRAISVITRRGCTSSRYSRKVEITTTETQKDRWQLAERALRKHAGQGPEAVLVIKLGAYAEYDLPALMQFHRAKSQPVTPLRDGDGPLDSWIVGGAWARSTPDCILPFTESGAPDSSVPYAVEGYVNQLANARDLRRLVVDAFLARCAIKPLGREIKPGVWMDDGAQVHRSARLVAPAYLGRSANVRPAAVISRFSNLEHHCRIGEGSVVASASILPHTIIGAGLDVSDAVVSGHEYEDIGRNVTLNIRDRKLIWYATPQGWRALGSGREAGQSLVSPLQPFGIEYSQHLSRAAGRLFRVFKGEV